MSWRHHRDLVRALEGRLATRARREIHMEGYRPSAVALLLADRDGQSHIPFTVRSEGLRKHSGQISLPGGVRDLGDDDFLATARRETNEELGIEHSAIRTIGLLDDIPTPTGFIITPVVAELVGPTDYRLNPHEVADVFEAPFAFFADRSNRRTLGEREFEGVTYTLLAYDFTEHHIWGATARILHDVVELIDGD